jgi:hypothetical protein
VVFCEECGCDSDDEARGWEAHLALEDDGTVTVVIFCPVCSVEVCRQFVVSGMWTTTMCVVAQLALYWARVQYAW